MSQAHICISYFDQILGPTTLYCSDGFSQNSGNIPNLRRILEFNEEEGTFIYAFRKYQSINHIFQIVIDSHESHNRIVMISYLIKASYYETEIDGIYEYLMSLEPILEQFSTQLKNMEEFKEFLNLNSKITKSDESLPPKILSKLKERMEYYFQQLSPNQTKSKKFLKKDKSALKKIFIYGQKNSGKKTFLENVEVEQFYRAYENDIISKIYEFVIDNIHVIAYDCLLKNFECMQCNTYSGGCVANTQGYIYIFDNSKDRETILNEISTFLQKILASHRDPKNLIPVVLLGNNFGDNRTITAELIDHLLNSSSAAFNLNNFIIEYKNYNLLREKQKSLEIVRWLIKNII